MGRHRTPAVGTAKWTKGVSEGGSNWNNMCQQSTKNPMANAAQQVSKARQNYATALADGGTWVTKMSQMLPQVWKTGCAAANSQGRYAAGASKGQPKMLNFLISAQPTYDNMRIAADAAVGPYAKVTAALQVLIGMRGRFQG